MPEPLSPSVISWLLRSLPKAQVLKIITAMKAGNFDLILDALNASKQLNQFNPTTPNIPRVTAAPVNTMPPGTTPFITPNPLSRPALPLGQTPTPGTTSSAWQGVKNYFKQPVNKNVGGFKMPKSLPKSIPKAAGKVPSWAGKGLKTAVAKGAQIPFTFAEFEGNMGNAMRYANPIDPNREFGFKDWQPQVYAGNRGFLGLGFDQETYNRMVGIGEESGASKNITSYLTQQNITPETFSKMTPAQRETFFKKAQTEGITQPPQAASEENPEDWEFYTRDIVRNRKTGKFYDALSRQTEIPPDIALMMYNQEFGIDKKSEQRTKELQAWADTTNELERYKQAQSLSRGQEGFYALNNQRMAEQASGEERARMASTYEDWRQRLLSELTSPRDWITRWQVGAQQNPYAQEPNTTSPAQSKRQGANYWTNVLSGAMENPGILNSYGVTMQQLEDIQQQYMQNALDLENQEKTNPWYPEEAQPAAQALPNAPGWLSQYVPGLQSGQQISRQFVPTPSGQQLTAMPWSQSEGLAGYAEWSGGRPWRDILDEASLMQPRTPKAAGNTRWKPRTQRGSV